MSVAFPWSVWSASVVSASVATGALVFVWLAQPPRFLQRALFAYLDMLHRQLSFLRIPVSAKVVFGGQLGFTAAGLMSTLVWLPFAGLCAGALPWFLGPALEARANRRLADLDAQLEDWLRALSGALRSGASLGQALEESVNLVEPPLREEVERVNREVQLGTSVSEALARAASRIDSVTLSTAMSAIRIGLRSGGGLPQTLMESAAALREMARLEGVVRTRTAESRAQVTVVAVLPAPMVALLNHINPELMRPLWEHELGWIVVSAALVLWVGSILVARKILDVDI